MPTLLRSQSRYTEIPEQLMTAPNLPPVEEAPDPRLENVEELVLGGKTREQAPAIALLDRIVEHAIQQSSSDIHIEPGITGSVVRMRIDGVMYDWKSFRREEHPSLISRLKILSRMNIAERRLRCCW
jgi:type II secretory ATPase GspE/PulE/Tfp pilus assembly ATPase PilB-like protein